MPQLCFVHLKLSARHDACKSLVSAENSPEGTMKKTNTIKLKIAGVALICLIIAGFWMMTSVNAQISQPMQFNNAPHNQVPAPAADHPSTFKLGWKSLGTIAIVAGIIFIVRPVKPNRLAP
jgi:hypothetical protein